MAAGKSIHEHEHNAVMVVETVSKQLYGPYNRERKLLLDRAPAHTASSLSTSLEPVHPMFIPGGYT